MTALETTTRVGRDGTVTVPVGIEHAGVEVVVTVTPTRRPQTVAEWAAFVERTRGAVDDPTFVRSEQGVVEARDVLE